MLHQKNLIYVIRGGDFKNKCGITYIKAIPQGFLCELSFTGQGNNT